MLNNYICAIDIGSSKIAACVAEIKNKHIRRIFLDSMASRGVSNGVIIDSIELVNCLTRLLKGLRSKSGINIKLVLANISGQDIVTKHSRAIVPLAERGNKVITLADIQRVNEQARILGSGLEEEIIHIIPSAYAIDSKSNVINPLGLYSHSLEVDLYLICGKLSSIQSLVRAVNQTGYEIKDLFFSGLATSKAVMAKEPKDGINLFLDIGRDITEILIFKDGLFKDAEILNIGGDDLTEGLSRTLKIPFELAEDIKRSHGIIGDYQQIEEDREILVKKSELYQPIKQRLVSEVVSSQAKKLCERIKESLEKKLSCYEVNNVITVGRTALLEGFIETLESILCIPVKLGRVNHPEITHLLRENSELAGQKYLTYLTSLGMLCDALQGKSLAILPRSQQPAKNILLRALNRFKEVYQEYF